MPKSDQATKPLDDKRHEKFAVIFAANNNAARAWLQVTGGNPDHADSNGSKWLSRRSITARVQWLRSEVERKAKLQKAAADKRKAVSDRKQNESAVLSVAEKRKFLADVLRTAIGRIDENSPLCQSSEYGEGGRKLKMPDKLRAIALDNDLAGDGAEASASKSLSEVAKQLAAIRSNKA